MEVQPQEHGLYEPALEQETLRGAEAKNEIGRTALEAARLSISQRLTLLFKGRVFIRCERKDGWSDSIELYAFRCPRHGVQTDYRHGFYERLDCPLCSYSTWGRQPETDLEV